MGNTIAPRPPPSTSRTTTSAPTTEAAPAPAATTTPPAAQDGMSTAATRVPSKIPLGPAVPVTESADQIKGMSNDELKKFTGEQVMGMNRVQFEAYQDAVTKDGGPGLGNLDPQASKAVLRKNMMKAIMEDCKSMAEKHSKAAFAF